MKVTCITESLGCGGAERQLCNLAVALQKRAVQVQFVTYSAADFYRPMLRQAGIPHHELSARNRLGRLIAVRHALRSEDQDVVLAFLRSTSVWAILAGWPRRAWGLVVSERLAFPPGLRKSWHPLLYCYADYVTTNSHANRLILEKAVPRLKGRVVTIYNCVNLDFFRPAVDRPPARRDHLSLVVAATYMAKKNLHGLVAAIATLGKRRPDLKVEVDWYGAIPPKDRTVFDTGLHQVREAGMQDRIRLHAATSEIVDAYLQADAVILPSFYEGLPNMICEAMACGRPILMSAVCDAGNLVKDGENGFLFDPSSSEDIAGAIERFSELDENVRARLGRRSREMAEALFDVDRFTAKYLEVLKAATRRTLVPIEHQPPEVPATAVSFAGRKSQ